MNREDIERIELEIAVFVRRAEAARIAYLKYKDFDRSTYLLLHRLDEKGAQGIKALADAFQLDLSTLSRQTASLEAKGFVERKSDVRDARINLLHITPYGRQQLYEVREARQELFGKLLGDWSDEERSMLGELLEKFNRTTEQYLTLK
ncbi:MarR family winged helix-turn-helix transcriptional regulator [Paenibacillus aurantiacus]|uniref:MarR family winged helix-turn-helix transcriptional regulator n=1 Tax=Paenibacillus aurantiacus TaxID=1936118 RepID=A0ABV5KXB3_9BACL